MKFSLKAAVISLFVLSAVIGCDGCYDDAVTNKVDAPNFTLIRGTNYTVKLSSETRDAIVVYTVDGSDPKTSDTAVEGNEVEIDFFTTIKAYAYKKGKRESTVLSFGLPSLGCARKVRYNSDYTVYDHISFANDPNGKRKVVKFYNGKGDDDQWFTGDDDPEYYILYVYEGDTLKNEFKYTGSGEDGKWFSSDDEFEWKSNYTLDADGNIEKEEVVDSEDNFVAEASYSYEKDSDDKITKVTVNGTDGEYPAKDINIYEGGYGTVVADIEYTGSVENAVSYTYTYSSDGEKETLAVSGGPTWTYNDPDGVNVEYTYEYENNSAGLPEKLVKKLGYGSDTQWGYTLQTFDSEGNVLTKTQYWDNAGEDPRAYYEYTYTDGLETAVYKYKTPDKESLRYWKETEYSGGKKSMVRYYNHDEENEKYDEYDWSKDKPYYLTKQRPDVASHSFEVAVKANLYKGEATEGKFVLAGKEYDHTGAPVDAIVDDTDDLDKLATNTAEKINYILKNTDVGKSSLTVHGKESGECEIMVSTYDQSINLVFDFNEYNDGDVIIDGILDLEATGTIDISGELVGEGTGWIDGDLYVADANPDFTDADYITISATQIVTNDDGDIIREIVYKTAGSDGKWEEFDDNAVKYVRKYQYNGDTLEVEVQYNGKGDDGVWDTSDAIDTSDDRIDYKIEYTIEGGKATGETVSRNYGIHGVSDGSDNPTETLKYYLGWRWYWDALQRFEIDWDDDYWHEGEDKEDLLVWSIEDEESE